MKLIKDLASLGEAIVRMCELKIALYLHRKHDTHQDACVYCQIDQRLREEMSGVTVRAHTYVLRPLVKTSKHWVN